MVPKREEGNGNVGWCPRSRNGFFRWVHELTEGTGNGETSGSIRVPMDEGEIFGDEFDDRIFEYQPVCQGGISTFD